MSYLCTVQLSEYFLSWIIVSAPKNYIGRTLRVILRKMKLRRLLAKWMKMAKCRFVWLSGWANLACSARHCRRNLAAARCLTEAGSDAASIRTTATKTTGGYLLNGEKIWITNGGIAQVALVFAKQSDITSEKEHQKITAFIVPTSSVGFDREKMPGKELGHRASDHAHLHFRDCFVAEENILGGAGNGFKVAMSALDSGRLGVAAGALGVHQACLDASLAFVRQRRQFGQRIADFEMVQACLADMKVSLEASRHLVYHAAWKKDQGEDSTLETSMAKLHATEAALKAASDAILLHGGRGYSNEYPVERYYRDIKGLQIYEGTSFIQKIVIARKIVGKES
jgi:alkylation response protein AidB-like acyl-CoA dehydrogenase